MLTQLATVKTRLGITDTTDDTILNSAIGAVSGRFDKECNRTFARAANAVFEFDGDKTEIIPPCLPIEAVPLAFDTMADAVTGWVAADDDTPYLIRKNSVISLQAPLADGKSIARVTYTGGYVLPNASPSTGQTALPTEIEQACVEQVCYWYQNRKRLGITSLSGQDGSIQQFAQLDLLPSVKAILKKYERMVM